MLGCIIKDYINDKCLIQSKIASLAGIKNQTFNDILNKRRKIGAVEYFKICKALNVSTDFFVEKLEKIEDMQDAS